MNVRRGRVAEIAENERPPTALGRRITDHAIELVVFPLLPFVERSEIDAKTARFAFAVDHANGMSAKRRDIINRQVGRESFQGARQSRAVDAEGGGEVIRVEVDGLGIAAIDDSFEAEQDDALDAGLRVEPTDQAAGLVFSIGIDPHDRHVLARQEPLDRPGALKQLERSAHRGLVQVDTRRDLDIRLRELDRIILELAKEVIDPIDHLVRRILVVDEQFLQHAISGSVQKHALRR